MSPVLIGLLFIVLFAIVLVVVSVGVKAIEQERKKKVAIALHGASIDSDEAFAPSVIDSGPEETQSLQAMLSKMGWYKGLDAYLEQAGLQWTPIGVVFATLVGVALGAFLGLRVNVPVFREFSMLAFALLFGSIPMLIVARSRRKRLNALEEQFPEALDFLARSMRAGHAFSVSLEMLGAESPEPLGLEFRRVFHEQNLGAPLENALSNLVQRVPLVDVRFFTSSVLLQRETGGNLAEILTKLSYVIRERFRLKGQVRAAAAHGRLTAIILAIMPIATSAALMLIAPSYLELLAKDEHGKYMIIGSIVLQILGYFWMRKIINIKV